jgi:hypothetical protein
MTLIPHVHGLSSRTPHFQTQCNVWDDRGNGVTAGALGTYLQGWRH